VGCRRYRWPPAAYTLQRAVQRALLLGVVRLGQMRCAVREWQAATGGGGAAHKSCRRCRLATREARAAAAAAAAATMAGAALEQVAPLWAANTAQWASFTNASSLGGTGRQARGGKAPVLVKVRDWSGTVWPGLQGSRERVRSRRWLKPKQAPLRRRAMKKPRGQLGGHAGRHFCTWCAFARPVSPTYTPPVYTRAQQHHFLAP